MPFCGVGVRKEFDVEGRQVLMFWYRNNIYAIEARSPAEGAYSEGFIRAKFTQVCWWPRSTALLAITSPEPLPQWPVSCGYRSQQDNIVSVLAEGVLNRLHI